MERAPTAPSLGSSSSMPPAVICFVVSPNLGRLNRLKFAPVAVRKLDPNLGRVPPAGWGGDSPPHPLQAKGAALAAYPIRPKQKGVAMRYPLGLSLSYRYRVPSASITQHSTSGKGRAWAVALSPPATLVGISLPTSARKATGFSSACRTR